MFNSLLDNKPWTTDDYPFKLYKAMTSKELNLKFKISSFDDNQSLWTGIRTESDPLFSIIATILFFIPIIPLFKIYVLLTLISIPIIIFISAENLKLNQNEKLYLFGLMILLINFHPIIKSKILPGLYSYILAISLSILFFSIWQKDHKSSQLIPIFILAYLAHITSPAIIFLLCLPKLIIKRKEIISDFKNFNFVKKIIIIFGMVLLIPIIIFYSMHTHIIPQYGSYSSNTIKVLINDFHENWYHITTFVIGFISLFYLRSDKKNKRITKSIIMSVGLLLMFGYLGVHIPIFQKIKPWRLTMAIPFLLNFSIAIYVNKLFKKNKIKAILIMFILLLSIYLTTLKVISLYFRVFLLLFVLLDNLL
jgi:hypothetical protein